MSIRPVKDKDGRPTGKFDVEVMRHGRRYYKRCQTEAEALRLVAAISEGAYIAPALKRNTLIDIVPLYLDHSRTTKAEHTFRADKSRIRIFFEWCRKSRVEYLEELTIPAIERFKNYYLDHAPFGNKLTRQKRNFNPRLTFNKYLQTIKAMLNWAVRSGYMTENPAIRIAPLKDIKKKFPRFFSKEELETIFKWAPDPYAAYFKFLAYTGMRDGELRYLEWADIDLNAGIIKIQSKPGFHPKTYEIRAIPIHPELEKVIKAMKPGPRFIFDDGLGNHAFSAGWALRILYQTLAMHNLPPGNLYTFRHTFASHLVQAGVDLATIKELMGHASIRTTEQYLHINPGNKAKAVERLNF